MRTTIEAERKQIRPNVKWRWGDPIKVTIRWGWPIAAFVSMKFLAFGGRLPRGWGIAWWEPDRLAYAILPIPLNVIFGLVRAAYWGLVKNRWSQTRRDSEIQAAYHRGIQEATCRFLDSWGSRQGRN